MDNLGISAKTLFLLYKEGILSDARLKPAVGALIRHSTESKLRHLTTNFRSRQAGEAIRAQGFTTKQSYNKWCEGNLRHEHMVPTSVIRSLLIEMANPTEASIAELLKKMNIMATITLSEDGILNSHRLKTSVPASFRDQLSSEFMDPLSRYRAAGLLPSLIERKVDNWLIQDQA